MLYTVVPMTALILVFLVIDVLDVDVFIRMDYSLPEVKEDPHIITNTAHMIAVQFTTTRAHDVGAKSVILCSHLNWPDGEFNNKCPMAPVAKGVEA